MNINKSRVLPNFLVIGAQRAGSTWLYQMLRRHPEVYMSERRKEINYFNYYYSKGSGWYKSFFPFEDDANRYLAIGEASPLYLSDQSTPSRIKSTVPECRLIVSLRNPVDRAYSHYRYVIRNRNEKRPFDVYLRDVPAIFSSGLYHSQLSRYLREFSRNSLLILIFEEMMQDKHAALQSIKNFLGLSLDWTNDSLVERKVNAAYDPRFRTAFAMARKFGDRLRSMDMDWAVDVAKLIGLPSLFGRRSIAPPLDAKLRSKLAKRYVAELENLERLLGRDLNIWRRCD